MTIAPGCVGGRVGELPRCRGSLWEREVGGCKKSDAGPVVKGGLVQGQRTLDGADQNQPAPGQEVSAEINSPASASC